MKQLIKQLIMLLPNGCSCSDPTGYPSNWQNTDASFKHYWYVQYYYDQPITFFKIDYTNKNDNQFEILVPIDLLIESINKFGSDDNKTQIKSEFQVFWDGYRKGK